MFEWFYDFHKNQKDGIFYGCPVGNLIVELSAIDEEFGKVPAEFIEKWTVGLSDITGQIHVLQSEKENRLLAQQVIVNLQGSIILLKVSKDWSIFQSIVEEIKDKYSK